MKKLILLTSFLLCLFTNYCLASFFQIKEDRFAMWYPDSYSLTSQRYPDETNVTMKAINSINDNYMTLVVTSAPVPKGKWITDELWQRAVNSIKNILISNGAIIYDYGITTTGSGHRALFFKIGEKNDNNYLVKHYIVQTVGNNKAYTLHYFYFDNIEHPDILENMIKYSGFYQ